MVPAVPGAANFPVAWTAQTIGQPGDILDSRCGGVPDPAHDRPIDDPDRHRRRLPAGAGRAGRTFRWFRAESQEHHRRQRQGTQSLPGTGRASGCPHRLLAVCGQDDHPLQRLPGRGPGGRHSSGLLHQRPGSDRRSAARPDAARLRSQHPDHHAVQGERERLRPRPTTWPRCKRSSPRLPRTRASSSASQDPIIVPQAPTTAPTTPASPSGTTAYARISEHISTSPFTPIGAAAPVTIHVRAEGHTGVVREHLRADERHPRRRDPEVHQRHEPDDDPLRVTSIRPRRSSTTRPSATSRSGRRATAPRSGRSPTTASTRTRSTSTSSTCS